MTTEKQRALELALGQIDKHFGRGAVMRLGEGGLSGRVEAISTGSISLDIALGVGGIPKGRVTEVFGTEASGKSTLAYHVMAEAQRQGGTSAYIDAEHALDPSYRGEVRRADRRASRVPARHGGAGPGDLRILGAKRRPRSRRGR